MTLDRATVEKWKRDAGFGWFLPPSDAAALAEDWLRMKDSEQAVLDVVNLYGDELLHEQLDLIGWKPRAALAAPVEAPTAHTDEALTECVHHYKMVVGGMQCAKCGRTIQ